MPTPTYTALATITLASTASSVTFGSIPTTYRDLVVVFSFKATAATEPRIRFNGDTGSNYSFVQLGGNGSSTLSNTGTTTGGWITPNSALSTSNFDTTIIQIMDSSATDKQKTYLSRFSPDANYVNALAVRWANTSAITSINAYTTSNAFAIGSTFSLYGVIA
jgi:hypothetical protein